MRDCIQKRARYLRRPEIAAMMAGQTTVVPMQRCGPRKSAKLTNAERAFVLIWHVAYIQAGFERHSVKRLGE